LVLIGLVCSSLAIERHEKIRSVSRKKFGLSRRVHRVVHEKVRSHNHHRDRPDEELVKDIDSDNWNRIRDIGIQIGKNFETTEAIFEKAEKAVEYKELFDKATAVKEAADALENINGNDPNSKLEALRVFIHSAAEFVPIPGVHEFLLAYSSMIGGILDSLKTFEKAVQDKQAQGTTIQNPGVMDGGLDLFTPLTKACTGSDFDLPVDARNWFYDHRDVLKAFSGTDVWKPDPEHSVLVHVRPGKYSDMGVMKDWVKQFWPIAALVAYGRTTEGNRFCMCGQDWAREPLGDCFT